jgi:IrrE N-terminal-like domain
VKNIFLRERTAQDINDQVEKVLRDLGKPEPPLNLAEVRELLRLDRGYYSSEEDGLLREVAHRLRIAGKQVLARPALIGDAIKKWDLKSLFLPDRKRILIDSTLPEAKQRWSEAHEIGHSIIWWHDGTMLGDNKQTLRPTCHAHIENEANFAAGQLLFLQEDFATDARDLTAGIPAIKTLKTRYGNTITTTLWRYVEQSPEPMVGGISHHPCRLPADFDPTNPFRYFVESKDFQNRFSGIQESEIFRQIQYYCADKRGGPLGAADILLNDDSGTGHIFHFETFYNQYEALTLGVYRRQRSLIVAAA